MEKHIRFLQKAYQIGSQKSGWERVEESRSKLLKIFTSYTEAVLKMIATGQDKKLVEGFRSSARLGAKSLSAKLKLVSDQTLDPSHVSAIEAQMANVKELLRRLEEVE